MNLFDVINDEQLLNFALTHICEREESDIDPVAEQICVFYAMKQLKSEQEYEPTDEEIHKLYSQMITEKLIEQLVTKGMVDVDFGNDIKYNITNAGKETFKRGIK